MPDSLGRDERDSWPRKVYLYGVALAGALLILYYLAQVAYRLLLLLLGDPQAGLFSTATANELARSLITAVFWIVHVLAIRTDGRLSEKTSLTPSERQTQERLALEERIARLEAELVAARRALAQLPLDDQRE